ncbi:copper resistance CopC/CopD family protein [Actinacidiphila acididurans]|uniref:Copper resistance protein CopC n=1 Tax=Actinacidiphila acididurans TaxID=2784346 RepID=A0ABS2TRQ5_9ACTN|nr:copper resistance protein CopC [Actinacidiphila acididurans]MBM9506019.1 copper resistance protein CopC [Actinacidiphila acididurans]
MNTRSYVPSRTPRRFSQRFTRRLAAFALALGGLLALLLGTAAPADAHAALIRTDPSEGAVVKTAPQRVVLTFSEGVLLSDDSLRVLDPHGTNVAVGTPGHADGADSGATATIALRSGIGNGTYTVAWRAVSQDSHPVAGAFTFSVGAPSRTSVDVSGEAAAGGGAAAFFYGVGRYVSYLGFALLVGGSVFLSVCWPRGALLRTMQRLVAGGWVAMVAGAIGLIMLRGPYVDGKSIDRMFDTDLMRAQLETRPGAALLSRLLLLAAAAVFLAVLFGSYAKREDPAERADLAWGLGIGGTVVAVGIAATWAMAEHASVGIQRQVAMPVDVVHLLSMAVWLGGLVTLLVALWAPSTAGTLEPYAVRRFSLIGLTAVTLLAGTGTYQAWRQIGTWGAFTGTHYGRLLLIKIGLVCVLVAAAWVSRRWTGRLGTVATAKVKSAAGGGAASGASRASKASGGTGPSGASGTSAAAAKAAAKSGTAEVTAGQASGGTAVADKGEAGGTGSGKERKADGKGPGGKGPGGKGSGGKGSGAAAPEPDGAGNDGIEAAARAAQLRRQEVAREAALARKVRDADPARRTLRRSVLAEALIAVVLLAVTTMLSGTQPGRAAEEQKKLAPAPAASSASGGGSDSSGFDLTIPYDTGGIKGKGSAEVTMSPSKAGAAGVIHILLSDPTGAPADVPEVRLSFTLPAKSLGPIPVPLKRLAAGDWTAANAQLPLPGQWQMSLTVRTSDIDEVQQTRNVTIGQ